MRYTDAKKLLLEHAAACSRDVVAVHTGVDEFAVEHLLGSQGDVEARMELRLQYGRKANHTRLSGALYLWSANLTTHPVGAPFLESMPAGMRNKVITLRRRLNGRVGYFPEQLRPYERLFEVGVNIETWSTEQLLDHLLLLFAVSLAVASAPLPVSTATGLMNWARRRANSGDSQALERGLIEHWRLASRESSINRLPPNPSIERTVSSGLRPLPTAAHVKR